MRLLEINYVTKRLASIRDTQSFFKFGMFNTGEQYDYNDDVIAFLVISGCLCLWQPSNNRGRVKKAD